MLKKPAVLITLAVLALLLLAGAVISLPAVHARLDWRVDFGIAYLRGVIHPVGPLPTPLPKPRVQVNSLPDPKPTSAPTVPPGPTPTSPPPPTPIPGKVLLDPPAWEKQDINNCGPATLTMYLRHYGWEGNQKDIADVLKPHRQDRNVNVEELAYYVHTKAGWLNFIYRVGGDEELLKKLIAAGIPVMVEESFHFESPYWPNDDLWAAHYNLLTGYDDQKQSFTTQDCFYGADLQVAYDQLAQNWQSFNHVYILIYPPELETVVQDVLGPEWDADVNRQHALDGAQAATQEDPQDCLYLVQPGHQPGIFRPLHRSCPGIRPGSHNWAYPSACCATSLDHSSLISTQEGWMTCRHCWIMPWPAPLMPRKPGSGRAGLATGRARPVKRLPISRRRWRKTPTIRMPSTRWLLSGKIRKSQAARRGISRGFFPQVCRPRIPSSAQRAHGKTTRLKEDDWSLSLSKLL